MRGRGDDDVGEVLTRSAVKETTIWFVGKRPQTEFSNPALWLASLGEDNVSVLRSDTHRVTYHTNYMSVGAINKYGDESSRVWYPWHTILRVEEKWLHRGGTVEIRSKFTVGEDTK